MSTEGVYPRVLRSRAKPIRYRIEPASGCWICTTHKSGNGYPQMHYMGKRRYLSRFVFEDTYGPVPHDMDVCHACDTPACINPEHLYIGTAQDNLCDASRRGRTTYGERNWHAKLTQESVDAIRRESGAPQSVIATRYGVSRETIGQILRRDTWRHTA